MLWWQCDVCEDEGVWDGRAKFCGLCAADNGRDVRIRVREVWRSVPGFSGYEVSSEGGVRSVDRDVQYRPREAGTHSYTRRVKGRPLVQSAGPYGHCFVTLCDDAGHHRKKVHTLVMIAFVGLAPEGMICRHLDGDAGNNDVANLKWGTHAENEADKRRDGRVYEGERNNKSKMKAAQIPLVRAVFDSGQLTQRAGAAHFGLNQKTYVNIGRRKTWKHVPESGVDAEALRRVCLHVMGRPLEPAAPTG